MLYEKIAVITHTLEVDSPRERVLYQSAVANTQKDGEDEPQPMTHSNDTGNNRDTLLQDCMGKNLPSQQEFQRVHVSGGLTATSISQPAANPTQRRSGSDPPSSHTNGKRECSEVFHCRHFAAQLPKLEIPIFTGEPLGWQLFWDCCEAVIHVNSCLTDVQELSYLCAQLRGEASSHCRTSSDQPELLSFSVSSERSLWAATQDCQCSHTSPTRTSQAHQQVVSL